MRGAFVVLLVLGLTAMGLGFVAKVSDELCYVLPWRDPHWLHYGGRNYSDPSSCRDSPDDVRAVGWVFGYFAPSRRLYAEGTGGGTPTLVWMEGSSGRCRI